MIKLFLSNIVDDHVGDNIDSIYYYITRVCCVRLPQSLLVAQQLANAVGGVMSGGAPGMNQPILIPFNAGGHLGGQQGLVLSLPTANIQSLVAAAAAGGIMTLPLQNLQGKEEGTTAQRHSHKTGVKDKSGSRGKKSTVRSALSEGVLDTYD